MLEVPDRPQASRGDSRTPNAGPAGTASRTAGRRPVAPTRANPISATGTRATGTRTTGTRAAATGATGTSATGSFGARSARNKRGIFQRGGIALPAAFLALLLVVVVWGAVKVMNPKGTGANSLFQSIDGLGTSHQVQMLAKEYQTLIAMTAATKTLTMAAKPTHTDPEEIIAAQNGGTSGETGGDSVTTMAVPANPTAAQSTAKTMLASFGFSSSQYSCLYSLWQQESTWNVYAENAASGAYGIPQALPGSKMASAGSDWQTSAATQIKWGLGYIKDVYSTPCGAWAHEKSQGFY